MLMNFTANLKFFLAPNHFYNTLSRGLVEVWLISGLQDISALDPTSTKYTRAQNRSIPDIKLIFHFLCTQMERIERKHDVMPELLRNKGLRARISKATRCVESRSHKGLVTSSSAFASSVAFCGRPQASSLSICTES